MIPRTARRGIAVLASLLLASCVIDPRFDPRGNDVSLEGSWTINAQPPTDETCAMAGIAVVELRILDDADDDFYTDEEFRFPCAQASFDTRPDEVLDFDLYRAVFFAYSADGRVSSETEASILDAATETHIVVTPAPDFVSDN